MVFEWLYKAKKGVNVMPKRGENIRKRKDGRWEGRYKKLPISNGKSKYASVYGKTYKEVKEKLKEAVENKPINLTLSATERTLGEVLILWKETNRMKHKGATETKYEYLIEHHILPELGKINISHITTLTLNNFAEQKLNCGRLDHKGGLSPSYVRSMMIIITSALKFAANEGMCQPLKTSAYFPTIDKNDLEIIPPEKQEILEQFILSDINETKFGIYLSLNCGLRIGEICALRWDDIDLENKVIHVRNTVARVRDKTTGKNELIIDTPKTKASLRDIPLHSGLIRVIAQMKETAVSSFVTSNTVAFTSPRTYEYRYHRILQNCDLGSYNYHTLRHTFATKCIIAGVDVKTLSEILGHSNVSITLNTYVHPTMDMKLSQIEKINQIPA